MPVSFAETPDGRLMIASGFDPILVWDGLSSQAVPAGVAPPTQAPVLSAGPASPLVSITGTYNAYLRFLDALGTPSNLSPISLPLVASGAGSIVYSQVQAPQDPKVVRRQILRNTNAEASVFYVDVDTEDLVSTSFTSTLPDQILNTKTAVPILDSTGKIFANQYTQPPSHKAVLAHHLSRMFAGVEFDYIQGAVKVTNGSKSITGVGTEWTKSLAGRYLYVTGATQSYQIASVDTFNQILALTANYADVTDLFAIYAIRPPPAERRTIYYSPAGLPEVMPATNGLSLQEDSDEMTGLMAKGSFLYILERRHIYRLTFQTDPGVDGFVFLSAQRGCLNQRCWVVAEDTAYMMDEQGIHAFTGGGESEPISANIQNLFRPSDSLYRINWQASKMFHAAHFPQQEVIRWFVALSGEYLPRHTLDYNYRQKRWWIDGYAVPIGSSCTGLLAGQPQVYLGSDNRRVLALWQGVLDGPTPAKGTVRGIVTSATFESITDTSAIYPSSGVIGNPVSIVEGTGKGQQRIVYAVSGTTLHILAPWLILPDTTSIYQLGGVQWRFQSGWFHWTPGEEQVERNIEVIFQATVSAATMTLRVLQNFQPDPIVWHATYLADDAGGFASIDGSPDLIADMTKQQGFVQRRMPGHKEFYVDGPRYVAIQLSGVSNADEQRIFFVNIEGAAW